MTVSLREEDIRQGRPHDLLRWFLEGFRAEVPRHLNGHRVQPYGLGLAEGFVAYMEEDAVEEARLTDDGQARVEEAYRFPMRTALRALAGKGTRDEPYPFMAHLLYMTACMDGDWDAACAGLGIIEPIRRHYVLLALGRLYERYHADPPAHVLPYRSNSRPGREHVTSRGQGQALVRPSQSS